MSRDCRYICQRAANAIISEVGSYRVSTDALHGINQFLDEFLVQLLVDCQSLDLSRIKASIFNLLPSTLGKNAIVEAELEVKTYTETEMVDYSVYEKMRTLGQQQLEPPSFPTKKCLALLRDKCLEFCTLADKDDQQWLPQKECSDVIISPIVAIYVTTVLEHMAEYILTAVAMTAETEDTDYVRIKELFLALVDDIQVGVVFQAMDLRDKMEKRSFAHGYLPRSSIRPSSTPIRIQQVRYSTSSMNRSGSSSKGLAFDRLDLLYDDDDDTTSSSQPSSNYSVQPDNISRPAFAMSNNTPTNTHHTSFKRAYKVFKNDHHSSNIPTSELASFSVYDPDAPTMNFEDLIRSGNTMRVSLTPNRLKSIETKNQMADDPTPSKFAWKRRSSSAPRQSAGSRPQTLTPAPLPQSLQSSVVNSGSTLSNRAAVKKGRKGSTKAKSRKSDTRSELSLDTAEPHLSDASSMSSYFSTNKLIEKSLPTPTSSTSSKKSKKRPPVPSDMTLPSSPSIASSMKSTSTRATMDSISLTSAASSASLSSASSLLGLASSTAACRSSTTVKTTQPTTTLSPTSTLRRSSLSSRKSRENIRRQREKCDQTTASPVDDDSVRSSCQIQQRGRSFSESAKTNCVKRSSSLQQQLKQSGSFERSTDTAPERPSSYVAKRVSATSSSHQPTPYESYAIKNAKESDTASTQKEKPSSSSERPISTAGTVGNTIKQLNQMVKQQSLSSSGCPHSLDEQQHHYQRKTTTSPSPSLSNLDIKADSLDPATTTTTTTRSRRRQCSSPLASSQSNSTFRRSMVLDKVLQFERAHSLDDNDIANRRASSYIPRRERFMYLQRDPSTLERPKTAILTTPLSSDATALQSIVRPGTSAAIAAAAARFAAGVSMAIQADTSNVAKAITTTVNNNSTDATTTRASCLMVTVSDEAGNTGELKEVTRGSIGIDNSQDDALSEHGVVDGDEEWFLPEDEWEDAQEQEHAVVDWLLGEAC